MKGFLDSVFHFRQNGTTARIEVIAGITDFMTLAYIIMLNPNILANNQPDRGFWNGIFMATCIGSALAMFCMAFLANKPFVLAPGMGVNSFFAMIVSNIAAALGIGYVQGYRAALCIILVEGILFIVLSLLNVRQKIVEAIPLSIRIGIAPAIGLMLINIGFGSNAAVYTEKGSYYVLRDFFGAMMPSLLRNDMGGEAFSRMILTTVTVLTGLVLIILFSRRGWKSAVLLGMLAASGLFWAGQAIFLHEDPFAGLKDASFLPPFRDMAENTLFRLDFSGLLKLGGVTVTTLIITFCMIDMFDTVGVFMGTASRAGMMDEKGNMPKMKEALLSDAIGTVAGACLGTSTVTTYAESVAGVEAGGRTGMTALVTGILFLLCTFLSPIAAIIPSAATSCALIYVGILMLMGLKNVKFDKVEDFAPTSVMLLTMPVTGSIGHAIGLGIILYTAIRVFSGRFKEVSLLTYVVTVLFLLKFFMVY